jgi:hypothetical protein
MKLRNKTLLVTATIALGVITFVYLKKQKEKEAKMLDTIADEGYETAGDILFPLKPKRIRKMNFGYGN